MRLAGPRFQAVAQDAGRLQNRCSANWATAAIGSSMALAVSDAIPDTSRGAGGAAGPAILAPREMGHYALWCSLLRRVSAAREA